MRVVEIAAVLVLMVGAVGGYLGAGRFWATQPTAAPAVVTQDGVTDGPAAMWGGDAGRTGGQPGPGPTDEVALRWRSPADEGFVGGSAPVALGDRVYRSAVVSAPTEAGPVGSTFVEALDAGTGRRLWRTELDVFGAPAATERLVYVTVSGWVGDADGPTTSALVALDAETGDEAWRARTGNLVGAMATSPIVHGDTVYVADPDGIVYAHDARTGARRWTATASRSDGALSLPDVWTPTASGSGALAVGDGMAYVVNGAGVLVALDAATGDERWRVAVPERFRIAPDLVVPAAVAETVVLRIRGVDESSAGPAPTSIVAALEAATGATRWEERGTLGFGEVAVGGALVLVPRPGDGAGSLVALDVKSGERRWEVTGPRGAFVALSVGDDVAYVAAQDEAMRAVDLRSGDGLWRSAGGGQVRLPPAVANGAVFTVDEAGTVSALASVGDGTTMTAG
jgi:outer membrane protein assembly factor BamB